jgi:hypothetical protein
MTTKPNQFVSKSSDEIRREISELVQQYADIVYVPNHFLPGTTATPLFAGNLTRQTYLIGANRRVSGDLTNTDNVMNNTFWIGVQPALSKEMLEFKACKIATYLSINFVVA